VVWADIDASRRPGRARRERGFRVAWAAARSEWPPRGAPV